MTHLPMALSSLLLLVATTGTASAAVPERAAPVTVDAAQALTRQVALGIAQPAGRDLDALDALGEALGGRLPAIWVIWSQWGSEHTRDFPTSLVERLGDRGVTPMIWWEPVDPADLDDPSYPRHRNIIRGDHDDYIRQFAQDARSFGGTVLLRFAHEANGSYFPWSVERYDNSARTFVRAWRHVHDIFAEEGAGNVRFVWSVSRKKCAGGCDPYARAFPGDDYVDVVGLSTHNWGEDKNGWVSLYDGARHAAGLLDRLSEKPLMLVEIASSGRGGDKPAWLRDGYREVYEHLPAITAIVYLDADLRSVGHPDWRLSSPADTLAALAELAAAPAFATAVPPAP